MATRQGRPAGGGTSARGRQTPQKRAFPLIPVLIGAGIAVVVLAFVLLNLNSGGVAPAAVAPGGAVETLPTRDHVADGTAVQYTTNPPTSGNHWAVAAGWGVYNQAPADEQLVHNLEHGGVVMYYDPTKLDAATIDQFKALTRDLNGSRNCTILTPRENMTDGAIALTSWGFLANLPSYDEAAIRAFWRDHIAQGPEFGPGQCG